MTKYVTHVYLHIKKLKQIKTKLRQIFLVSNHQRHYHILTFSGTNTLNYLRKKRADSFTTNIRAIKHARAIKSAVGYIIIMLRSSLINFYCHYLYIFNHFVPTAWVGTWQ